MLNIGVIGYGYWGPNLVRNFAESPRAQVRWVSDRSEERLALAQRRHPGVRTDTDYQAMLRDPEVTAVAIATPVSTHFPLALECLRAGKHVWVEKPFTHTVEEGERLIEEAAKRGLRILVDHTFVYTGAVRKMKELIDAGTLGDIYYYDSMRVNLGLFQFDVDVIWDLVIHDLAIIENLFSARPTGVSAIGRAHFPGRHANTAFVTLHFENDFIAHINASWLSPVKVRQITVAGSKQMIVYDDMSNAEKIKVYDRGADLPMTRESTYNALMDYRMGDMWAPRIAGREALSLEVEHFLDCIEQGTQPITSGEVGLQLVRLLSAATTSMQNQGSLQKV
ncbi:MAG TPA: Gfo/Idh/MocA family oxidoreductase [Humidesulfovibrio sp.]|uniref:Gfo/Idh/MocA family protein n=1 Tax=Humidesulfovibrio sp. TaxID=2910988 RepID=UPI002B8924F9|nr:Gfo/Idh/MocA family oxidoreductase [Humidesulfovibrio sp.]HWR03145.1 Gfo/Idh/MocA family oxidoreductase [Humidesulfovibrio sp.]